MPRSIPENHRIEPPFKSENRAPLMLSERDFLRVLDLLEHPPLPSHRLLRAAQAGRRFAVSRIK